MLFAGACKDSDSGQPAASEASSAPGMSSTSIASPTSAGVGGDPSGNGSTGMPSEGECTLWNATECGPGRKCMPYSLEDDRIPDSIKCCDAVENGGVEGDVCTGTEYNGSCLDDCAPGLMCVLDDEESLVGLCRAFCEPNAGQCEVTQTCKSFFELLPGVPTTPICMERCDPLTQDCVPSSWHCIPDTPTESGQSGFLCSPPPPGPPKQLFDVCALANDCERGLACIGADRVPDCPVFNCCSAYCTVSEGDAPCTSIHPDMRCIDWMSPDPAWDGVGVCAIPT